MKSLRMQNGTLVWTWWFHREQQIISLALNSSDFIFCVHGEPVGTLLKQSRFIIHIHHDRDDYSASWNWLINPSVYACKREQLSHCVCVCVCVCLCVCATWRTFLWLHYGEKMTPWPALGLLKRESTRHTYAHQQTHSWKTHTYTTKRNIFNAFYRARQARARSQRCPFFFPMCRCFHPRSPSSSKWMHNSACPPFLQTGGLEVQSRRMSGLPSNAVLMVPCVVGRERQLIEILRDSAERYIMGPFCRGRLVKSD